MLNTTSVSKNTQIPNNPITSTDINDSYTLFAGDTLTMDANYTDADNDAATFARNFTNGSFDNNTGVLSWTTTSSDAGTHSWQINVTDGSGSVSPKNFTVTVTIRVYIPPSPTSLANSTGNFYVNHTWQAGAGNGNITDSYNVSVNGTWT